MPNAESDIREFLARIYELLRNQQQALFDLHISIAALETALRTNQSFAELHDQAKDRVRTPELVAAHDAGLAAIELIIGQLRGGQ